MIRTILDRIADKLGYMPKNSGNVIHFNPQAYAKSAKEYEASIQRQFEDFVFELKRAR